MGQRIINGFPQFYDFTIRRGVLAGNNGHLSDKQKTLINTSTDLVGEDIYFTTNEANLIEIKRDGASLIQGAGYTLISDNMVEVYPGLIPGEVIEVKKITGVAGFVDSIPTESLSFRGEINKEVASCNTNGDGVEQNCMVSSQTGKTVIKTLFALNDAFDLYINGNKVNSTSTDSQGRLFYSKISSNEVQLNQDYSSEKMFIEIVQQNIIG